MRASKKTKHVLRLGIQSCLLCVLEFWQWWSLMILMPLSWLQALERSLPPEVLELLEERWRCLLLRWACSRCLLAAT